jgi:hypothetical protein
MPDDPALELGAGADVAVVVGAADDEVVDAGAADDEVVDAGAAVLEEPELPQPATRSAATTSASAPTPVARLEIAFVISQSSVFVAVLMLIGEQDAPGPPSFPSAQVRHPGKVLPPAGIYTSRRSRKSRRTPSGRLGCIVLRQAQSYCSPAWPCRSRLRRRRFT